MPVQLVKPRPVKKHKIVVVPKGLEKLETNTAASELSYLPRTLLRYAQSDYGVLDV
jgi:hypothetical protein